MLLLLYNKVDDDVVHPSVKECEDGKVAKMENFWITGTFAS